MQCKELFKRMVENTKLKCLKLNEVDLGSVPANILAEAVNKVYDCLFKFWNIIFFISDRRN